jgi:hypothetical protein
MKIISKLMMLALPVALAACGGNGDKTCVSDANLNKTCVQDTHNLPEGIWLGAAEAPFPGDSVMTIVLETGQYYNLYTMSGGYQMLVEGVMSATNNQFTDNAAVAIANPYQVGAATVSGTFTTNVSMAGMADGINFNGNYQPVYTTPLAVSDVTGNWVDAQTTGTDSLTVNTDGTFTGTLTTTATTTTPSTTCALSGKLTPRATGKHLLDGTVLLQNNGTPPCAFGNGLTLPFEATLINGQLTAVGVTPQRDRAFVLNLVH